MIFVVRQARNETLRAELCVIKKCENRRASVNDTCQYEYVIIRLTAEK